MAEHDWETLLFVVQADAIVDPGECPACRAKGGTVLTEVGHLKESLGMVLAPNGNIITSNGSDGNMIETTPAGKQVAVRTANKKTGARTLFGLAVAPELRAFTSWMTAKTCSTCCTRPASHAGI